MKNQEKLSQLSIFINENFNKKGIHACVLGSDYNTGLFIRISYQWEEVARINNDLKFSFLLSTFDDKEFKSIYEKVSEVKIQYLVEEYKSDPNCWPELWIKGLGCTPDEEYEFIKKCL